MGSRLGQEIPKSLIDIDNRKLIDIQIGELIKAGVKTIVQPGGSIRDQEVINAANKAKIKMFFTNVRHFNH